MKKHGYQKDRFKPGYWNGLCGWQSCGQYFNMYSSDRVSAMMEIVYLLRENRIEFMATRWKNYYRIAVDRREFKKISELLKAQIDRINKEHMNDW